jgi:hypothetical protein
MSNYISTPNKDLLLDIQVGSWAQPSANGYVFTVDAETQVMRGWHHSNLYVSSQGLDIETSEERIEDEIIEEIFRDHASAWQRLADL